ncbi:MAG: hypothetical protein JSV32_04640 [Dehalococcoidia bacterium]|nr:MAG: hypothetical protein JSV32_04640 [Dehalococcoidia bacterium]
MNQEIKTRESKGWASGGAASLYLIGALHLGLFAFATKQVGPESAPLLGVWILGVSIALLMLGMVELRRGDILFGTLGMVFGGLLGLGGGLSFLRSIWIPGTFAIDGWWFLSGGIILFLLLPAIYKVSKIMIFGTSVIGTALIILGLGMIGIFGQTDTPMVLAGWLALFFGIFSWYGATALIVNSVYKKSILPF